MTRYDDYGVPVGAFQEPESLSGQAWRTMRAFLLYRVKPLLLSKNGQWSVKRSLSFSLVKVLVVVWFVVLYWGERSVFKRAIDDCRWENWEQWGIDANPHHLIFVADPQLVDPHTYPGRPWPLNTLTVKFTDQYLRRTYSHMQKVLYPDSVVFLGDLFDGGREWSTRTSRSPEEQWRNYGDVYWQGEYQRFGRIFFDHWGDGGLDPRMGQPGRKMVTSLPGNHDLGFGKGVQMAVRKRFNAYFGDGNRMDVIGNHTFVSLDTVSLSALTQENGDKEQDLWEPGMDFLDGAQRKKQRLVSRELRKLQGENPNLLFSHDIIEREAFPKAELPHYKEEITEFPTVLLSHVPLYRDEGTKCGPLREHWPPSPPPQGQYEPPEKDPRNAIAVRGGYQYQNVLTKELTSTIAEKVGNIQYAFSGDDHDYCEVTHRSYPSAGGGIKEITVKSLSWAMGVRLPGVVMASMWNPVDANGKSIASDSAKPTMQTHLCLMPDQLGIFIRYALLFGVTIIALTVRAALVAAGRITSSTSVHDAPLLPTINDTSSSAESEKAHLETHGIDLPHDAASSNSSSSDDRGKLQIRNSNARTRSVSPSGGYGLPAAGSQYAAPLIDRAGYFGPKDEYDDLRTRSSSVSVSTRRQKAQKKGYGLFMQELRNSVVIVGAMVFAWYFWLLRNW